VVYLFWCGEKRKGKKRKVETRGKVFAVAITVMLLIALTINVVAAGSPTKVRVTPEKQEVELNTSATPSKMELNTSGPMAFPVERVLNVMSYDDAVAENAYCWDIPGGGFAVRFTPPSYPAEIITAKICFWPAMPDVDHEEFAVYVYDDDGPGGEPYTCLGGPIYHTATDWGWCDVDLSGLGISIASGDFYIFYEQLTYYPDCEALCYDINLPLYGRSWDYAGSWTLVPHENYMIRCVVNETSIESSWTFMVYLDGDNNLESAGIDDFLEMSSVGSSSDVNIVVQFDRIPYYDSRYDNWVTCKRFHITSGMTPTPANAISDLGECNMGDPNTLKDFVTWAMTYFPADNYALILWNHGSGWKKWVPWDTEVGRGVCWDETNGGDYLTLQETGQAMTGKYVQLLGYDACFMHMVEVVYQVKANARISVGSEDSEPNDGWPYDTILADLNATPVMTPHTLGAVIVQRYIASYGSAGSATQSAVDNSDFSGLVTAVDNLAQALITEINAGNWTQVQQARSETELIYYPYYIDLYHFAQKIQTYVPGAASEAQAVMANLGIAVYAEANGSWAPNEHGLSIYYPLDEASYSASYSTTAFAIDTLWNEFLMKYYTPPPEITSYAPESPVNDLEGVTRTFSIAINQIVDVIWQINGSTVQTNASVTEATYTNTSAVNGTWNVSAIVTNANGTDMQTWTWTVTSPCFIATAAYGTPLHEDITVLRDFRDEYLMTNLAGRAFVKAYYTMSPPIAEGIRDKECLRTAVRTGFVKPAVYITRIFVG
jgi:clostripain